MYQNPALNAPPGPDGLPMPIDARQSQEHFEVQICYDFLWLKRLKQAYAPNNPLPFRRISMKTSLRSLQSLGRLKI